MTLCEKSLCFLGSKISSGHNEPPVGRAVLAESPRIVRTPGDQASVVTAGAGGALLTPHNILTVTLASADSTDKSVAAFLIPNNL